MNRSKRQSAIKWYNHLKIDNQLELMQKYKSICWEKRMPLDLTGREVELMYEQELKEKGIDYEQG